jgi:vacuolar-type H+-ATPase subunit E/Vma4
MNYLDYPNLSPEQKATYKTLAILENSAHHQRLREAEATAFEENERYQAELRQQAEKFRIQREAELKAEAEKLRLESNKSLEIQIRERFFRASPNALESDFQRVKDSLKDKHFSENMNNQETVEDLMRQTGNYSAM